MSSQRQAILLADVDQLGAEGEVVEVSPGYLRNFLQPRNLARPATRGLVEEAQRRREETERIERERLARAEETAQLLTRTVLTLSHRAGEDGKLFGSVTAKEISDAIRDARGVHIDPKKVELSEPIRATGTYQVEVEVAPDAVASIKTIVTDQS